jgi:hypothetical protein
VVRAAESFAVEMPFLRGDAPIAIVVERLKTFPRPLVEGILAVRRIELAVGAAAAAGPASAHLRLDARQLAVAIPIVDVK